ncbi:MAG TPA: ribosome small subunit-dependent GTPase A, partial [Firmicutes bacterium]|nr:ribosome small subunit-dependent GTPase A [Bacillota bacterium]
MLQGRIMRSVSGFYDIQTDTGLYRCKGRGKFRQNALTPVVGDQVLFEPSQNEGDSFITKIFPRKNFLARPPLANLDQLVFVVATRDPAPNTLILDK